MFYTNVCDTAAGAHAQPQSEAPLPEPHRETSAFALFHAGFVCAAPGGTELSRFPARPAPLSLGGAGHTHILPRWKRLSREKNPRLGPGVLVLSSGLRDSRGVSRYPPCCRSSRSLRVSLSLLILSHCVSGEKMADEVGNGDDLVLPVGKEAVDRLIRENSEIFSDTQCKVCCAALISESQKLAHYQSKKHANKVRRYMSMPQGEEFTPPKKMKPAETVTGDEEDRNKLCPVCNMTFSSPVVAQSHYQGKTHAKNLKMKEQGVITEVMPVKRVPKPVPKPVPNPLAKPASNVSTKVDEDDPEKFCKLCRATFNNPHMSQQHYMGKKHKKQETKNEIMTTYKKSGNSLPQTADIKPAVPGSTTD